MRARLPLTIATTLLLILPSIAPAQDAVLGHPPATAAPSDSTRPPRTAHHKTHRLKYGAIGAVAGAALGALAAYVSVEGNHSDMEGLYYVFYIPVGLVVGTIVGVSFGSAGGAPPSVTTEALDLGPPRPSASALRITATLTF
jgi:ABC-type Fe3+ transport system permease subunit